MGRMIPLLNLKGFDSKLIEDITGISALIQSRWLIAGEVFTSIMRSGEVSADVESLLYAFKFKSVLFILLHLCWDHMHKSTNAFRNCPHDSLNSSTQNYQ